MENIVGPFPEVVFIKHRGSGKFLYVEVDPRMQRAKSDHAEMQQQTNK